MRTMKLLALAGMIFAPAGLAAQVPGETGPDTVVYNGSRGTVVYTHGKHAQYAECRSCHHESRPEKPLETPYQKCTACHLERATEDVPTSLRDAYHNTSKKTGMCYDCHNEEAARGNAMPLLCADCHKRQDRASRP